MKLYPVLTTVLIAFLALNACTDTGTFLPNLSSLENDQAQRFRLPQDGAVLDYSRSFPLVINDLAGSVPISLSFSLLTGASGEEQLKSISYPETGAALQINLPALTDGRYRYRIVLQEQNSEKTVVERSFLILANPPKINSIASYPSIPTANVDILLQARVERTDALSYFARWKLGGKVVKEGPLASFLAGLMLRAPDRSGIHAASLELYPIFDEQTTFDYPAPVNHSFDIVVADKALAESGDLGPANSFSVNLHFKGHFFAEHETQNGSDSDRISGERVLLADKSNYGYRLGQGSIAVLPFALLANYSSDSFNQVLVTKIKILQASKGSLLVSHQADGGQSFALSLDEQSRLVAEWTVANKVLKARSESPIGVNTWQTIRIALVSVQGRRSLLGFFEDQSLEASSQDSQEFLANRQELVDAQGSESQGQTRLGSIEKPIFLIDELGVFNPALAEGKKLSKSAFQTLMMYEFGSSLLFAEDFSEGQLPRNFDAEGEISIQNGHAQLSRGASLGLPSLDSQRGGIELRFAFKKAPEKLARRLKLDLDGLGQEPIFVLSDGRLVQGNTAASSSDVKALLSIALRIERQGNTLEISTSIDTGSHNLAINTVSHSLTITMAKDSKLNLKILSDDGPVEVDKVSSWLLPDQVL